MAYRRSAAHAGSWYDDSSEVLGEQLKLWLKKAAETTAAATSAEEQQSRVSMRAGRGSDLALAFSLASRISSRASPTRM
jgi:hypothetical protein